MLRPRRESLHSDGIADQKSLQKDFCNKIGQLRTLSTALFRLRDKDTLPICRRGALLKSLYACPVQIK
jgi:hypothetical protein